MSNPAPSPAPAKAPLPDKPADTSITLIRHYDLLYWWVVWLYAAVAWVISGAGPFGWGIRVHMVELVDGKLPQSVVDGTSKALNFHPDPLLGIGFIATFLFVAIFTAVRARGVLSAVLVFAFLAAGAAIYFLGLSRVLLEAFPRLRIHMNQGFYGAVFSVLFPIWVLTTFFFNRFHYYSFAHGKQIGDVRRLGGGTRSFNAHNVAVHKLPDDIFVHRVLGLRWLGFGTGDIEVTFTEPGSGTQKWTIHNVWSADKRVREIEERIR